MFDLKTSSKYNRIQELQRWGLNTPNYTFFSINSRDYLSYDPGTPKVSLRYYADGDNDLTFGKQPHSPLVSWPEAKLLISKHINHYHILVNPGGINPKDTVCCGTLMMSLLSISGYGTAVSDIIFGPSTVRDACSHGISLTANLHGSFYLDDGTFVSGLTQAKAQALRCPFWNQVVFEWSYYPYPIGRLAEPLIFWEMRSKR